MGKIFHFIGIGGIGMSGLARIMLTRNHRISGSDLEINSIVEALVKQGASVRKGHAAHHITEEMIVVYSSDIKENNPEYRAALDKGCRILHRADLLAKLIRKQKSLAIAGTHGKTTTSALLTSVLLEANKDPTYAIGGVLVATKSNSCTGQGKHFVFEADESDQTFLKYHPYGAIVTNIDHDHLINYQNNFNNLLAAFKTFTNQVESTRHLFWFGDDPNLFSMELEGNSYGFKSHCTWQISNLRQEGFQLIFDLKGPQVNFKEIILKLIGEHNALNAAAVFGLAINLEIDEATIRKSFAHFQGVERRCETKGMINDILFIDDYAHHPTEITTTLKGIRKAIGSNKRLVAIFQPHRYSRTEESQGKFGACFEPVDEVIVTDIYAAGELPISGLSGAKVMDEIKENHQACQYVPRTALTHKLSQFVKKNDVIITLGAGDITRIANEIIILLDNQNR